MEIEAGALRNGDVVVGYFILTPEVTMGFSRYDAWDAAVSDWVARGARVRLGGYIEVGAAAPSAQVHYDGE